MLPACSNDDHCLAHSCLGHLGRLLLHGEHDRAGTIRRDMPQWARQEPGATYQVIPDAAHNTSQDNPEFTNRAILAFLERRLT